MSTEDTCACTFALDEDGFLANPETWTEDVARELARRNEVAELTESHWKVIRYLREYYAHFGSAPTVGRLVKETGFKVKEIYELFPAGPALGACRLAGLPRPAGCV
jgi:tRNA 2-thiouridine synthesizing protein E